MDKTLFNFSVTWHNQKRQYVGRCAEFSFLSYLADTDRGAYQGILNLVCDFAENIEKYRHLEEFDKWFASIAQNAAEDSKSVILHKQVIAEISVFMEMKEMCDKLKLNLQATPACPI